MIGEWETRLARTPPGRRAGLLDALGARSLVHPTERHEERADAEEEEHRPGPPPRTNDRFVEHLLARLEGEVDGFPDERVADPDAGPVRDRASPSRRKQIADTIAVDPDDQLTRLEVFLRRTRDRDRCRKRAFERERIDWFVGEGGRQRRAFGLASRWPQLASLSGECRT